MTRATSRTFHNSTMLGPPTQTQRVMVQVTYLLVLTYLEVGAAAAAYEQRVSGEDDAELRVIVTHAASSVAGRGEHLESARARRPAHLFTLSQQLISFCSRRRADRRAEPRHPLLERARARDVVGVRVGVEGEHELSAHRFDGGEVAIHLRAVVVARDTRQPDQSNLAAESHGGRG